MNEDKQSGFERIVIEKFKNGDRIKFMSFTVKTSEKGDLQKLVMDLLITIAEKHGYSTYFDSNAIDPLASLTLTGTTHPIQQH